MNLAAFALRNRTTTVVLTVLLLIGGISSYNQLSRLEDPEFTIKEALVVTPYPGASAAEVQKEVSDKIELAVQQLGQLMEVESRSVRDLSTVTVRIKKKYRREDLPQVWDELRRKVGDMQDQLPPGAGPSEVNDDYGDVWGVFVAVYGPEYSYAELKETIKLLRRELSLVQDVAKVELWGERTESVYVVPDRDRMSQLGVKPAQIIRNLRDKNVVVDAGRAEVGSSFIAIAPTGTFSSVKEFENLLITGDDSDRQIYLRDVANVTFGFRDRDSISRMEGHESVTLSVKKRSGENIIRISDEVKEILAKTDARMQKGVEHTQHELNTIRTGRASASLLDGVRVDYYGTPTPLNQVARISAPEPRLLIVSPWERQMLQVIEKAIL